MFKLNQEYNKQYKKSKRSFKPEDLYFVSGLGSYPSAQSVLFALCGYKFILEELYVGRYTVHRYLSYFCHSFHFVVDSPNFHCIVCSARCHYVRLLQGVQGADPSLMSFCVFKHWFASFSVP